jgi:hypothetical protein
MTENPKAPPRTFDPTSFPTIKSLETWCVGIGSNGLPEVRFELNDPDEAKAWVAWITIRIDEMNRRPA